MSPEVLNLVTDATPAVIITAAAVYILRELKKYMDTASKNESTRQDSFLAALKAQNQAAQRLSEALQAAALTIQATVIEARELCREVTALRETITARSEDADEA